MSGRVYSSLAPLGPCNKGVICLRHGAVPSPVCCAALVGVTTAAATAAAVVAAASCGWAQPPAAALNHDMLGGCAAMCGCLQAAMDLAQYG